MIIIIVQDHYHGPRHMYRTDNMKPGVRGVDGDGDPRPRHRLPHPASTRHEAKCIIVFTIIISRIVVVNSISIQHLL